MPAERERWTTIFILLKPIDNQLIRKSYKTLAIELDEWWIACVWNNEDWLKGFMDGEKGIETVFFLNFVNFVKFRDIFCELLLPNLIVSRGRRISTICCWCIYFFLCWRTRWCLVQKCGVLAVWPGGVELLDESVCGEKKIMWSFEALIKNIYFLRMFCMKLLQCSFTVFFLLLLILPLIVKQQVGRLNFRL